VNGGRALVDALLALGVDTGFTVPGESFLTVLEALRQKRDSFRLLSTRHESGAAFAAEAYGRLSGRPAAVFVSRGPGATNAAIGIHTARQGSTPLLLFIGDVRTRSKGREAFQEIDHHRMFGPVAKAVMEPQRVEEIAAVSERAVAESISGRPGPVVVVLPRDITESNIAKAPLSAVGRVDTAPPEASAESIRAAVEAISQAKFPIIIAGEMICHECAGQILEQFADRLGAPVLTAYRQMDVFPNNHPAYAGHLEINRADFQRGAFAAADLVLAVGTRLDGITTEDYAFLRAGQQLVHIYPDAEVLEGAAVQVAIRSGVEPALTSIGRELEEAPEERVSWRDGLHAAYLRFSDAGTTRSHGAVDLSSVVQVVTRTVGDEAVLLTDGGSFARWVHRYYRFNKARRFAGPVSGAMGYAVPGALGAALACPQAPIIAFVGDGGFMMTGQELSTAAREKLNTTIIVCDNQAHGSILYAQWRQYDAANDYATRIASPDFVAMARAYSVAGWRVEDSAQFPAAFRKAMGVEGPSLIHLITDQRDIVPGDPKDDVV
jgi:acetolactate synthase I/II/III large subunit